MKQRFKAVILRSVSTIFLVLSVQACNSTELAKPGYYGAQVGVVNHTDKYIYSSLVQGSAGGHAYPYFAGVANVCCVRVPDKWTPGLQFTVAWNMPADGGWKEKLVAVERYDEPGSVYLHFFPNDEVRIVVSNWAAYAAEHPIQRPPRDLYDYYRKRPQK